MDKHLISSKTTILEALGRLNSLSGGVMTLIVVDEYGRMSGTLTDGDVRRALINGGSLDMEVGKALNRSFSFVDGKSVDVAYIKGIRAKGIKLVPVLDRDGRPIRLIDLTVTGNILPMRALIMAGGKGERLRPLTLTTPKPLLEIEGKAIIDYNIEALVACGIEDITVSVNYLADKIEEHFARPISRVSVKCLREPLPMGTIGAAALLPPSIYDCTLVMNSDLLTTISFEEMYLRHIDEQAAITMGVIPYQVSVPYAILTTDGSEVAGLEEKPTYSYFANGGVYIIADRLLRDMPKDRRTDATDLISNAIEAGEKVVYYPITGTWIDVGSPADFSHAAQLMKHHKTMKTF